MDEERLWVLPLESGVTRLQQVLHVERMPGMIGGGSIFMMLFVALYGQWKALYGIPVGVLWIIIWRVLYQYDPQYFEILIQKEWRDPWPPRLYPAESVLAEEVRAPASSPYRGEAGSWGDA